MRKYLFLLLLLPLAACVDKSEQSAKMLLDTGYRLAEEGNFQSARIVLDSLHNTYPKCVDVRRVAKSLEDSMEYVEAKRTMLYADSLLQPLLKESDVLLKSFSYEKNEKYEDAGKYVHRLLRTGSNSSRCYLQAYVTDNRETIVKSYYCGSAMLLQSIVCLESQNEQYRSAGRLHSFEAGDYHSILTMEEDKALSVLNFISMHCGDRLRVVLEGTNKKGNATTYTYYLSDSEKKALEDTYKLGVVMKDIKSLEDMLRISRARVEKYENKYML